MMTAVNTKKLLIDLLECHSSDQLLKTIKKHGITDADWKELGGDDINAGSIVFNQQSKAEYALAEKITNIFDTTLISQCLQHGIEPISHQAPKDMKDALNKFFRIKGGELSNLDNSERRLIGNKSGGLIITGETGRGAKPTYTFFDHGEGQSPEEFNNTFLRLVNSNKNKIKFVQGRYGQGSTGVIKYCDQGLQLIVSRKNPNLPSELLDNNTHRTSNIGFTITRVFDPIEEEKNPPIKYLTINGDIPSVPFEKMSFLRNHEWEYGSIIRCFNYEIGPTIGAIGPDLWRRLCVLFPYAPLPLMMWEERETSGKAHSYDFVMNGLSVRLNEDRGENIEETSPIIFDFEIDKQHFRVQIYVLKNKAPASRWQAREGLVFVYNGQSNAYIDRRSIYSTKDVGMQYLEDRLITIVDASDINNANYHKLFTGNRETLADTIFSRKVMARIKEEIKTHPELKRLLQKHRTEKINETVSNSKEFNNVIEELIKKSPTLSKIFNTGNRLSDPTGINPGGGTNFIPKLQPTFFILDGKYPNDKPKSVQQEKRMNFQFLTDAPNNYFAPETRARYGGDLKILLDNQIYDNNDISYNLYEGRLNMSLNVPNSTIGTVHKIDFLIEDYNNTNGYNKEENNAFIIVSEPKNSSPSEGGRKKTGGEKPGSWSKQKSLDPPYVIPVYEDKWDEHKFTKESVLKIWRYNDGDNEGVDLYVNMDNIHLKNEKATNHNKATQYDYWYETFLQIFSFAALYANSENETDDYTMYEKFANDFSMFIIPTFNFAQELDS